MNPQMTKLEFQHLLREPELDRRVMRMAAASHVMDSPPFTSEGGCMDYLFRGDIPQEWPYDVVKSLRRYGVITVDQHTLPTIRNVLTYFHINNNTWNRIVEIMVEMFKQSHEQVPMDVVELMGKQCVNKDTGWIGYMVSLHGIGYVHYHEQYNKRMDTIFHVFNHDRIVYEVMSYATTIPKGAATYQGNVDDNVARLERILGNTTIKDARLRQKLMASTCTHSTPYAAYIVRWLQDQGTMPTEKDIENAHSAAFEMTRILEGAREGYAVKKWKRIWSGKPQQEDENGQVLRAETDDTRGTIASP